MATLLNGRVHDWVSAVWTLGPPVGQVPLTVQSVTYPEHGSDKNLINGTGRNPIGYTRDFYKPTTLMMEFLVAEWDAYRSLLGPGYMDVEIPSVSVTYLDAAAGLTPRTVLFVGCHVTKEQESVSQGTDPAKIQVTFQPNQMVINGVPATLPTNL